MVSSFSDLAEHTGTLVILIGTEFGLLVILLGGIWKIGRWLLSTFKDDVFTLIGQIDNKVEELVQKSVEYALKKEVDPKISQIEERQFQLRTSILPSYQKKEDMDTWGKIMTQGFCDMKDRIDAISRRLDEKLMKENH